MSCLFKEVLNENVIDHLYSFSRPKQKDDYHYGVFIHTCFFALLNTSLWNTIHDVHAFLNQWNQQGYGLSKNTYLSGYSLFIGFEQSPEHYGVFCVFHDAPTLHVHNIVLAKQMIEDEMVWQVCKTFDTTCKLAMQSLPKQSDEPHHKNKKVIHVSIIPIHNMNPTEQYHWKTVEHQCLMVMNTLVHLHQCHRISMPLCHFGGHECMDD